MKAMVFQKLHVLRKERTLLVLEKGANYHFCSKECKINFDKVSAALLNRKCKKRKLAEEERSKTLGKVVNKMPIMFLLMLLPIVALPVL